MDSSSWIHVCVANSNGGAGGNSRYMCGYTASSCIPATLQHREQEQHELLGNSEIQHHLNKINMEMNMDDEPAAAYSQHCISVVNDFDFLTGGCGFPSSSSTSSSLRSASLSCSPEISSTVPHVLPAPARGLQFPEVSSLLELAPGLVLPYDDQCIADFHDTPAAIAPGGVSTSASAFRRYDLHLSPWRSLTKPACGQTMFKTAISVLAKMHTAMRYKHQQQQEQQQQVSATEMSGNQLQHMISERKRREKLNDSFRALKTVLPQGSKKLDKTSMLIIAREYVNSLKSKVCELEEKNQALQLQLARLATSAKEDEDGAGEKVEIQITRAAAVEHDQTGEVFTVNIATPAIGNKTDMVLRTLQCLKEHMGEDVSLVSMSTADRPHRASLTLHLKIRPIQVTSLDLRGTIGEEGEVLGKEGENTATHSTHAKPGPRPKPPSPFSSNPPSMVGTLLIYIWSGVSS